jgi:hypothetical protein
LSKLVEHFLNAPHDQVDHKIIEYAKVNWRKPLPTPDQCKQTLKLMEKYHASTFVRKMMYTIQLESEEAEQIVFDDKAKRPEFKC